MRSCAKRRSDRCREGAPHPLLHCSLRRWAPLHPRSSRVPAAVLVALSLATVYSGSLFTRLYLAVPRAGALSGSKPPGLRLPIPVMAPKRSASTSPEPSTAPSDSFPRASHYDCRPLPAHASPGRPAPLPSDPAAHTAVLPACGPCAAVLLGDIGAAAAGRAGRVLVYLTIYSLDATRCAILHLAATQV